MKLLISLSLFLLFGIKSLTSRAQGIITPDTNSNPDVIKSITYTVARNKREWLWNDEDYPIAICNTLTEYGEDIQDNPAGLGQIGEDGDFTLGNYNGRARVYSLVCMFILCLLWFKHNTNCKKQSISILLMVYFMMMMKPGGSGVQATTLCDGSVTFYKSILGQSTGDCSTKTPIDELDVNLDATDVVGSALKFAKVLGPGYALVESTFSVITTIIGSGTPAWKIALDKQYNKLIECMDQKISENRVNQIELEWHSLSGSATEVETALINQASPDSVHDQMHHVVGHMQDRIKIDFQYLTPEAQYLRAEALLPTFDMAVRLYFVSAATNLGMILKDIDSGRRTIGNYKTALDSARQHLGYMKNWVNNAITIIGAMYKPTSVWECFLSAIRRRRSLLMGTSYRTRGRLYYEWEKGGKREYGGFECSSLFTKNCWNNFRGQHQLFIAKLKTDYLSFVTDTQNRMLQLPYATTKDPTKYPTTKPTKYPSTSPTKYPSRKPTKYPSRKPTKYPSTQPTKNPQIQSWWSDVQQIDIESTEELNVVKGYDTDANGKLIIDMSIELNVGCEPSHFGVFIKDKDPSTRWRKIRYTQTFWGCSMCYSILGNTEIGDWRGVDLGLTTWNINGPDDKILSSDLTSWSGKTSDCAQFSFWYDASNEWECDLIDYKGSIRVEKKRNLNNGRAGFGSGHQCARFGEIRFSDIEVFYDISAAGNDAYPHPQTHQTHQNYQYPQITHQIGFIGFISALLILVVLGAFCWCLKKNKVIHKYIYSYSAVSMDMEQSDAGSDLDKLINHVQ